MGVTTRKKISPIISGEIIFDSKIPNLNHNLFNGFRILEFSNPKTKKIIDIKSDQINISLLFNNGHNEIIRNTIKKTIPKLLLDPIFSLIIFNNHSLSILRAKLSFLFSLIKSIPRLRAERKSVV